MLKHHLPFGVKYMARALARNTVGKAADRLLPPRTRFIILTNGRTGSNLLVNYLEQSSKVRLYGEIFGNYYFAQRQVTEQIRRDGAVSYLEAMLSRCGTETHVGAKILYAQLEKKYADARGLPDLPSALEALSAAKDIKIIHLRRLNLLDVVTSIELAKQNRSYIGESYRKTTVTLREKRCRRLFDRLTAQEERYRQLFSQHDYLEMTYEELVAEPAATLANVSGFLGLAPVEAETRLRKQRRASNEETIANYDALKQAFSDTPYARYFT